MPPSSRSDSLKADYSSPSASRTFEQPLPANSIESTADKSRYLATLGSSIVKLQAEINEFLTAKMEEDKAHTPESGKRLEEKAEENYGEEMVEEGS